MIDVSAADRMRIIGPGLVKPDYVVDTETLSRLAAEAWQVGRPSTVFAPRVTAPVVVAPVEPTPGTCGVCGTRTKSRKSIRCASCAQRQRFESKRNFR